MARGRFGKDVHLSLKPRRKLPSGGEEARFSVGEQYQQPAVAQGLHRLRNLSGRVSERHADAAPAKAILRAGGAVGLDKESL